jgi:hypothetical protein
MLLFAVPVVLTLALLLLTQSEKPGRAKGAALVGTVIGLVLLALAYSDTPSDSEPHLSSMYADLFKDYLRYVAWPMVVVFGAILIVKVHRQPPDGKSD